MVRQIIKIDKDKYTFEEYLALDDGNRYELHNGRLYMMSGVSHYHIIATVALTT